MANSIGTASFTLTLTGKELMEALKKKEKEIKSWSSRVGSGMRMAGKAGVVGMVAGLAGMAIVDPFERIADKAKQGDFAQALGVTVEKFTGLAGVAKAAGGDTQGFMDGLVKLSAAAQDAITGGSEDSIDMFKKLNINLTDFSKLDAVDKFYALSTAMESFNGVAGEKVDMFSKVFDKNQVAMLSKTTEEIRKEAAAYQMSTASMAEAQVAARSLSNAKAQINKALDDLSIALAPVIDLFAEMLPHAIAAVREAFDRFGPPVMSTLRYVVQGVAAVRDVWNALQSVVTIVVGAIVSAFGKLVKSLGYVMGAMADASAWLGIPMLAETSEKIKQFGRDVDDVGKITIDSGIEDLQKFGQHQQAALDMFDRFTKEREKKIKDREKALTPKGGPAARKAGNVGMVEGSMQGSKEATKIIQSWQFGAQQKDDLMKRQVEQGGIANGILEEIKKALVGGKFIKFGVL